MWQDLCVAAGHACRLAALVVQGSSTAAAMAEYGPVYSTFGERKRGAVYGWKSAESCGVSETLFLHSLTLQSFSDLPKTLEKIRWTYKWCMMYDGLWNPPAVSLRNDAYILFMAYTHDILECVWRELCLRIGPPWATFESGMDDAAFFPSHMSTQPFCESLTLECKLTTFFSVVKGIILLCWFYNCTVKHFIYVQHMFL